MDSFKLPAVLRGALLAAGLSLACAAAAQSPRDRVESVAQAIEGGYFDAVQGARIAAQLRAAAARGEFETFTDPRDLAAALTARLRSLDGHFRVDWQAPDAPRRVSNAGARREAPAADPGRRVNYGIRRVEILPGNIGYLDLREFAHFEYGRADAPARRAIEAALQLLSGTDAVLIDLRDNGGGSPAMVGYLASAFTPPGADIYNTFRTRGESRSEAPPETYPHPRLEVPLYVLASARTGSAAEALAYTLKNAGRARVIGDTTAGAANPGGPVDAGHGLTVFVPNGSPVSPITKGNWEGTGVVPDLPVPAAQALTVAYGHALEAVLARRLPEPAATEARWVLEALRAQDAPPPVAADDYVGRYGELRVDLQDGRLAVQRGRRPPLVLLPVARDVFAVADDPTRRMYFKRDAQGAVVELEAAGTSGPPGRYSRQRATPTAVDP